MQRYEFLRDAEAGGGAYLLILVLRIDRHKDIQQNRMIFTVCPFLLTWWECEVMNKLDYWPSFN